MYLKPCQGLCLRCPFLLRAVDLVMTQSWLHSPWELKSSYILQEERDGMAPAAEVELTESVTVLRD